MKGLSILGSTGSVGTNVLRVVDSFPERFAVIGLAGGSNVERLAEQVARYRPRVVSVATRRGSGGSRPPRVPRGCCRRDRHRRDGRRRRPSRLRVGGRCGRGGRGPRPHLSRPRGGEGRGPREQGDARHGGRADGRPIPGPGRPAPAHRQRALRSPPVPRRSPTRGGPAPGAHRLGRPLPEPLPGDLRQHHAGRGAQPPDLVHGTQDHNRLGHPHEQGTRGHRSPVALRDRVAAHRDPGPPAVRRPLHGGVRGRHGPRPARRDRHAAADPVRAQPSRALGGLDPGDGLRPAHAASTSTRPTRRVSPASGSPIEPSKRAAPCRRS